MTYTAFERDLLEWFERHASDPALIAQLRAASPKSREYTGAGLFLELEVDVPAEQRLPETFESPIAGPQIAAPSLPNGAGSILFLEAGLIATLEVYTYADPLVEEVRDHAFHAV